MDCLVDTCYLIDLWREQRAPGRATAFSAALATQSLGINWVTAGEFLAGGRLAGHDPDHLAAVLGRYQQIQSDAETVAIYARLVVAIRQTKRTIAQADLWIASSAIRHGAKLVTRNTRDFERLPGLILLDYSSAITP